MERMKRTIKECIKYKELFKRNRKREVMELYKKRTRTYGVLWKAGRPFSKEIVENSIDKTWKDSSIHYSIK